MGNIDKNKIRRKGFIEGSKEYKIEEYCINMVSLNADNLLKIYTGMPSSRNGKYINSDLMKMAFPFYANSNENRKLYNMSITNSAAVLTNELYVRSVQNDKIKRCIFIAGPYGAGKSYFVQSLFEGDKDNILKDCIVYEGSITPPAFDEKIEFAMQNGVTPYIIALNPTLELSMRNIKERARKIGRNVEKKEVISKFSNFYWNMKHIIKKFDDITYTIYNKESNIPKDLENGSTNLQELYHGTEQEINDEYDRIIKILDIEDFERF